MLKPPEFDGQAVFDIVYQTMRTGAPLRESEAEREIVTPRIRRTLSRRRPAAAPRTERYAKCNSFEFRVFTFDPSPCPKGDHAGPIRSCPTAGRRHRESGLTPDDVGDTHRLHRRTRRPMGGFVERRSAPGRRDRR
jgi:hypothetical protein